MELNTSNIITIILTVITYTGAFVGWLLKLQAKVVEMQNKMKEIDKTKTIEDHQNRITILEVQGQGLKETIGRIEHKLDQLIDKMDNR